MKTLLLPLLVVSVLQTPQPGPVIRTTTRLVQVSVVVHDKKGVPVSGLTKDDFVLADNGQEQKIRLFSVEKQSVENRSVENQSAEAAPAPAQQLPAGVITNRLISPDPTHEAATPNLTVILLDGLNTTFTDQHFMRKAALHVLGKTHPGDRIALYALHNGLTVLHDFTSQPLELQEAVRKYQAGNSKDLAGSTPNTDILPPSQPGIGRAKADTMFDEMLSNIDDETQGFYIKNRVRATVSAFESIAFHLQGLPGRKNLIWISGSFPFSFGLSPDKGAKNSYETFDEQVKRVVEEFNTADIAIYPVDARGLIGMFAMYTGYAASSQGYGKGVDRLPTNTRDQIWAMQATMVSMAKGTGGKAFYESNDLEGAIQTALDDANISYTLSYSPTHNEWNGESRQIKVVVKRPGVEARYRNSYLAIPDPTSDAELRQKSLIAAGNIPLLSTGLTLQAGFDRTGPASDAGQLKVTMDANEISFKTNEKGEWTAIVDFLVLVRDAQGNPLNTTTRTMRRVVTDSDYQAFRKTGLQLTLSVPRVSGAVKARLVARDAGTGLVGTLDIPIN